MTLVTRGKRQLLVEKLMSFKFRNVARSSVAQMNTAVNDRGVRRITSRRGVASDAVPVPAGRQLPVTSRRIELAPTARDACMPV